MELHPQDVKGLLGPGFQSSRCPWRVQRLQAAGQSVRVTERKWCDRPRLYWSLVVFKIHSQNSFPSFTSSMGGSAKVLLTGKL